MKLGILFSGGKDSTLAALLAREAGHDLACLITLRSANPDSYLFHTPATEAQAAAMRTPLVTIETKGEEEVEVDDLRRALAEAKKQHGIQGVVTGAVGSVYQATRNQRVCNELGLEVFNPLWQLDQKTLLRELRSRGFRVVIVGVAAEPLDESWVGRVLDDETITELLRLRATHGLNPAGEGGEYESLVLDCPLFHEPLAIAERRVHGEGYSWRMEVTLALARNAPGRNAPGRDKAPARDSTRASAEGSTRDSGGDA